MTAGSSALLGLAGTISLAIALLQFVMYFGGPDVYRLCGTPESLIAFRVCRPGWALVVEVVLFTVFTVFGAYAFSGAGWIRPLPWRASGLAATAVVYLLRGIFVIPQLAGTLPLSSRRDRCYSLIALAVGVAYALPTSWHWQDLE